MAFAPNGLTIQGVIDAGQAVSGQFPVGVGAKDPTGNLQWLTVDGTGALVTTGGGGGSTTANQGTPNTLANAWPVEVTDGANVLGTAAHPLRTDPTGTTAQPVTIAQLAAAAAAADGFANPTTTQVETFPMTYNGATWDRVRDVNAANAGGFSGIAAVGPMALDVGSATMRRGVTGASTTTGITGIQVPANAILVWDGTSFRPQAADTSGRVLVQGAAAAGAAVTGNPVLVGGSDGANAQNLQVQSAASPNLRTAIFAGTLGPVSIVNTGADALSAGGNSLYGFAIQAMFNGSTLDRQRNNNDATLLASASRTTTQTSADITTFNLGAITVILDMTVVGTGSVTVSINGKDPASGKYYNLLTGAAVTTNSTNVYRIQPGIVAVANKDVNAYLPRVIQIVVTANNANPATYSVGYTLHVQ